VPTDDDPTAALTRLLAEAPRRPADVELFSSSTRFGEPGAQRDGAPMAPAPGPAVTEAQAVQALARIGMWRPEARLAQPVLVARVPDPGPRAGLLALSFTVAAPVIDVFVAGMTSVDTIGLGPTASRDAVVGPATDAPARARVVNERYRAEMPTLLAGSLAHDLLRSGPGAGQFEEAVLHAVDALVHLQLLARDATLARTGTELARRKNSLALSLLSSRDPGSAELSVHAPDFWNFPFVRGTPVAADAPALLYAVLELATGVAPPTPLRYDDALGKWWSEHGMRHALPLDAQWRAAHALGLVGER
jgi:hypothetical protein